MKSFLNFLITVSIITLTLFIVLNVAWVLSAQTATWQPASMQTFLIIFLATLVSGFVGNYLNNQE